MFLIYQLVYCTSVTFDARHDFEKRGLFAQIFPLDEHEAQVVVTPINSAWKVGFTQKELFNSDQPVQLKCLQYRIHLFNQEGKLASYEFFHPFERKSWIQRLRLSTEAPKLYESYYMSEIIKAQQSNPIYQKIKATQLVA